MRFYPDQAKKELEWALHASSGVLGEAAKRLKMGLRTLNTYLDILGMRTLAEQIRLKNGIPSRGRAGPRRKTVTRPRVSANRRR